MAEEGSWSSIRRIGLLSTTALLDLFEITGDERNAIESQKRARIFEITHPKHGRALVRDNKPLREQFLSQCLEGMTSRQWFELLNRKVFFWVQRGRLEKLLTARAYRKRRHDVLTIDTRALLERHLSSVTLCPINSGATLYPTATRRGPETFRSLADYDLPAMVKWRGAADAIVELTVDYSVPNIESLTSRVERRFNGEPPVVLWEKP